MLIVDPGASNDGKEVRIDNDGVYQATCDAYTCFTCRRWEEYWDG